MAEAAIAAGSEAALDLQAEADARIARCGGDVRLALVMALVMALAAARMLEAERALTEPVVSYGFSRGWHCRPH